MLYMIREFIFVATLANHFGSSRARFCSTVRFKELRPQYTNQSITMSATKDLTFICPLQDITHIVIDTDFTSRLNEHFGAIETILTEKFGVLYECLFTYDGRATPRFFVSEKTPERLNRAQEIFDTVKTHSSGPICLEVKRGGGNACFDVIDVLCKFEHCVVYSNVTKMGYIQHGAYKILLLGYDTADD
jgi:hypothetical protein